MTYDELKSNPRNGIYEVTGTSYYVVVMDDNKVKQIPAYANIQGDAVLTRDDALSLKGKRGGIPHVTIPSL